MARFRGTEMAIALLHGYKVTALAEGKIIATGAKQHAAHTATRTTSERFARFKAALNDQFGEK